MKSSPEFPLFASLPPELRLKIWFHALPGPQVKTLTLKSDGGGHPIVGSTHEVLNHATVITCYLEKHANTTPLFQICRESREVALKTHELCFERYIPLDFMKFRKRECDGDCPGMVDHLIGQFKSWSMNVNPPKKRPNPRKQISTQKKRITQRPRVKSKQGQPMCPHQLTSRKPFSHPGFYLQPEIDTVYFPWEQRFRRPHSWLPSTYLELGGIRSVAMDFTLIESQDYWNPFFGAGGKVRVPISDSKEEMTKEVKMKCRLEEFIVVVGPDGWIDIDAFRVDVHGAVLRGLRGTYDMVGEKECKVWFVRGWEFERGVEFWRDRLMCVNGYCANNCASSQECTDRSVIMKGASGHGCHRAT